jgi:hypothetical protein
VDSARSESWNHVPVLPADPFKRKEAIARLRMFSLCMMALVLIVVGGLTLGLLLAILT